MPIHNTLKDCCCERRFVVENQQWHSAKCIVDHSSFSVKCVNGYARNCVCIDFSSGTWTPITRDLLGNLLSVYSTPLTPASLTGVVVCIGILVSVLARSTSDRHRQHLCLWIVELPCFPCNLRHGGEWFQSLTTKRSLYRFPSDMRPEGTGLMVVHQ